MDNRMTLVVVFTYTVGVLVTGLWVPDMSLPALSPLQIGIVAVLAVLWTAYFGWTVVPRILNLETEDDERGDPHPADSEELR